MNLKQGKLLKHGEYRIERELGHGGFGITYLAVQVGLNRRVAIKEFFMSEYCNRDAETSHVTVGSEGSKELVARFRTKFIKEAQNIACLKHPHIISIHDVFEENGTAYYVMEYHDYGSLTDLVKRQGRLSEADALRYTRQIADALRYIHERKMNHLDVKPGNILIDETDHAVLIDFGLSKRYDDEGKQTSTTPVGISHGYAPLEQYKKSGVGTFSPATDIYSLGATLYKLVTGATPPEADVIIEEGIPSLPSDISPCVSSAIQHAMQPLRRDRPQSIEDFLVLLEDVSTNIDTGIQIQEIAIDGVTVDCNTAVLIDNDMPTDERSSISHKPQSISGSDLPFRHIFIQRWLLPVVVCVIAGLIILLWSNGGSDFDDNNTSVGLDTVTVIPPKPNPTIIEQEQNLQESHQQSITTKTTARLSVTTTPSGAIVYVDGKSVGYTPINGLEVANGNHTIKLSKAGYKEKTFIRTISHKDVTITESLVKNEKQPSVTSSNSKRVFKVNKVSFTMVDIVGATFTMGSPDSDANAYDDEKPAHQVKLKDYSIGETEVTQALWLAVMGDNPSFFIGDLQRPVENVSWNDCQTFIRKLNSLTGSKFRLPTEAEWEYAARGGSESTTKYSGSTSLSTVAWYASNSKEITHAVKGKSPNRFGLYDMSGNVGEWCFDWKEDYPSSSRTNPNKGDGHRVVRGGSWNSSVGACRVTHRNGNPPNLGLNSIGLRLAL